MISNTEVESLVSKLTANLSKAELIKLQECFTEKDTRLWAAITLAAWNKQ